ncbi:MAG: methyltransferase domain-containing protein [Armatimonadetes bacterium]|nr:methyltransferase domain-containing protein [Armatimonadota bacterium]MDE2207343.1 methyltransferase domain-containing protein [Armatimonadota bacterium]
MRRSALRLLRCPTGCLKSLEARSSLEEEGRIQTGSLHCAECGGEYPIEQGIARMLPGEMKTAQATGDAGRKKSEMRARDAQAAAYDRMLGLKLFGVLELPATMRRVQVGSAHIMLEAGCGTGRMTRAFAANCASLVAVDFSWESLLSCRRKLDTAGVQNVDLIQADLCRMPLADGAFHRIASCQVLEHIPSATARDEMVRHLARVAAPDARIVVSAYQHSVFTRAFDRKEGEHSGGIYYYRFGRNELRALLSTAMHVDTVSGSLVYHFMATCRPAGDRAAAATLQRSDSV